MRAAMTTAASSTATSTVPVVATPAVPSPPRLPRHLARRQTQHRHREFAVPSTPVHWAMTRTTCPHPGRPTSTGCFRPAHRVRYKWACRRGEAWLDNLQVTRSILESGFRSRFEGSCSSTSSAAAWIHRASQHGARAQFDPPRLQAKPPAT